MHKAALAFILTISFFTKAFACLNGDSKFLKDGTLLFEDMDGNVPYGHAFNDAESLKRDIAQLDSLYKATKDLDYLSDKGLVLILLKQYDQAIKLYQEIEKTEPGRYSTASNIGTAYELIGQNEKALKWIRKSVEIDSTSHKNSEWIHVKILEAKIKGEQFYTSNFLLNTDFGNDNIPVSAYSEDKLQNLSNALYYQLNERVSFVKPKEKIVAQLLFDLGNLAFLLRKYNDAAMDYQKAKNYGYENQLLEIRDKLSQKYSELQEVHGIKAVQKEKSSKILYLRIIISIVLFAVILGVLYMRRRRNRI